MEGHLIIIRISRISRTVRDYEIIGIMRIIEEHRLL